MDNFQEDLKRHYIQGNNDAIKNVQEVIETELLWKTQDEGFIFGLKWVLDQLKEIQINDNKKTI